MVSKVTSDICKRKMVPACSSRSPWRNDNSRALFSAVAACAVGVDPIESIKRGRLVRSGLAVARKAKASSAAVLTAWTSEERNDEASDEDVDEYALPA